MLHSLANHIGWCQCGDRVIVLDLEADRYISVTGLAATAVVALGAHPLSSDFPYVADLFARGWLSPAPSVSDPPRAAAAVAVRDALAGSHPPARWHHVARAAWLQLRTKRLLRRGRLIDLLTDLELAAMSPVSASPAALAKAQTIAAAFAGSALVMGSTDQCLPRAIAMVAMAHRAGIRPMLVFGVCADPFAAHCWVQLDEIVLTGDLDQVRQFTPVLALA